MDTLFDKDGIDVYRHYVGNRLGKFSQLFGISWIFFTKKIDIVHLHGFQRLKLDNLVANELHFFVSNL
jgi:hypothetical protein